MRTRTGRRAGARAPEKRFLINFEQLRLIAQALAGPALKGGELADVSPTGEQSALGKLLANWNAVMVGKAALADKRAGQQQLL